MTKKEQDIAATHEGELVFMNGYDDCIVGVVERYGMEPVVCYDKNKIIKKLMNDGTSHEDAEEWFYFNQIGTWWGETTPCFLTPTSDLEHPKSNENN